MRTILKSSINLQPPLPAAESPIRVSDVPPRWTHLAESYLFELTECYGPNSKNAFSAEFVVSQLRAAIYEAEAGMDCAIDCATSTKKYNIEKSNLIKQKIEKANAAVQPLASKEDRVTRCRFSDEPQIRPYTPKDYEKADGEERMTDEFADCQLPKYLSKTTSGSKGVFAAKKMIAIQTLSMYIQDKINKQQSALLLHPALEPIPAAHDAVRPLGLTRGTTLRCEKDIEHHDLEREIRLAEKENREPVRPRKRPSQGEEGHSTLKRLRVGGGGSDNNLNKEEKDVFKARDANQMHVTVGSSRQAFSSRFTLGTYVRKSEVTGRRPPRTRVTETDSYFVSLRRSAIAYAERAKAARKRTATTKGRDIQPPQ